MWTNNNQVWMREDGQAGVTVVIETAEELVRRFRWREVSEENRLLLPAGTVVHLDFAHSLVHMTGHSPKVRLDPFIIPDQVVHAMAKSLDMPLEIKLT